MLEDVQDVDLPEGMTPHPEAEAWHGEDGDPYEGMEPDLTPEQTDEFDPEKLKLASTFAINDLGNSRRLVLHYGENLMSVPRVGWHVWDDRVWGVDPDMIATRTKAQNLSELVLGEVPYLVLPERDMEQLARERDLRQQIKTLEAQRDEDGKLPADVAEQIFQIDMQIAAIKRLKESLSKMRTAHRTFARSSGNTAKIKAALTEAEVPLAVRVEDLDTRPLDINTQSGVLRFVVTPRSGTFPLVDVQDLPPDRALRMTKIMTVAYDTTALCPIFTAFLDRIMPDPDMQRFLQRWFGYSMLGITNEQALAFFYGMGANGKSVLMEVMARLLGSYAATAKIESLTGQNRRSGGDATPDLINIVGARMVRTSEPEKGVQWQEGLIKQLTGGEPILVRDLNEKFFEVTPIFKLTIAGNHAPDIRGMDDGIWRRLMIVPFDVQIPKAEKIPYDTLVKSLLDEGPGILNWMVEGARYYLEGGLAPPDQVVNATDTLRADADPYGKFLDTNCIVTGDGSDSISSRELMQCFTYWQMQMGETPYKERTISLAMKDHSRRWRSRKTGKQFTARETGRFNGYDGLRLTDLFRREWENAPKNAQGHAINVTKASDPDGSGSRYGDDI
ncbi:phage/plasmid primase, P4 family [Cypionkella aquatica]|uniref:phage/plasmid primase, P4 family n=1 Tax=Cypionkella aquatica TaxID=1756042 RepID=UPI0024E10E35|nr:phage/plasmid primase, P4 family [Cypionkella aquatica]